MLNLAPGLRRSASGIAGSAIGTVLAQIGSALALLAVVVRAARRQGAALRPRPRRGPSRRAARASPLLVRTLTLRASLLVTTSVAARLGAAALAAHQLALTLWTFLAFALDASPSRRRPSPAARWAPATLAGARAVTDRMVRWGAAQRRRHRRVLLAALAPLLGALFTADPAVQRPAACRCCWWRPCSSRWPGWSSCWTAC